MPKQTRKQRRELRRKNLKELIKKGTNLPDLPDKITAQNYQQVFAQFWPFMKKAFEFIKSLRITGAKADKTLDELIVLGENMKNGNEGDRTLFQQKITKVWGPIRTVLNVSIVFSPDKVDKVLDKIIEVGDWLSDNDDEDETALTQ